jgi:hypothetical protein
MQANARYPRFRRILRCHFGRTRIIRGYTFKRDQRGLRDSRLGLGFEEMAAEDMVAGVNEEDYGELWWQEVRGRAKSMIERRWMGYRCLLAG